MKDESTDSDGEFGMFYLLGSVDEVDVETAALSVSHAEYKKGVGWEKAKLEPHGKVTVRITTDEDGYRFADKKSVEFDGVVQAVTDTGAQMDVAGEDILKKSEFDSKDLVKVSLRVKVADDRQTKMLGGLFANIIGMDLYTGEEVIARRLIYVVEGVRGLYLSKQSCRQLGVVEKFFPRVCGTVSSLERHPKPSTAQLCRPSPPPSDQKFVADGGTGWQPDRMGEELDINGGLAETGDSKRIFSGVAAVTEEGDKTSKLGCRKMSDLVKDWAGDKMECGCPKRVLPPKILSENLPCELKPENSKTIEKWLIQTFLSSSFNCCERQKLPMIDSAPPLELTVDKSIEPVAVRKPASIPVNWLPQVKADIDRDVALGVIEPVPANFAAEWCSRMSIVGKSDGSVRRVIDLRPINEATKRITHPSDNPYLQARSVPPNTFRTTSDAWNGFHSIPLCDKSRQYTIFLTPWGKFWYLVAPQGHVCSMDGYNIRYGKILENFQNHKRIVDDTIMWDCNFQKHFWQVIDFLTLSGENGVIQSPGKFKFGRTTIEFVGFKLSPLGMGPSDDTFAVFKIFNCH